MNLRQSRPNKAGLKCPSVCAHARTYVRIRTYERTYVRITYVRTSTTSFFDLIEILHLGRAQWVTHDSRPRSMTRSKVKVTSPLKMEIRPFLKAISSAIYNGSWQLITDSYTRAQYLHLIGPDFWYFAWFFVRLFCSPMPATPRGRAAAPSTPSP